MRLSLKEFRANVFATIYTLGIADKSGHLEMVSYNGDLDKIASNIWRVDCRKLPKSQKEDFIKSVKDAAELYLGGTPASSFHEGEPIMGQFNGKLVLSDYRAIVYACINIYAEADRSDDLACFLCSEEIAGFVDMLGKQELERGAVMKKDIASYKVEVRKLCEKVLDFYLRGERVSCFH